MLASEVIALAREYLIEARDVRFIDDPEAFRELDEEQRRLVDRIIAQDNPSYPFPPLLIHGDSEEDPTVSEGEKCQQGQSETELVEVELPEDVWRLRRVTVTYDDGSRAHVKLVPEAQAHLIPRRTPAAYLRSGTLRAVDGRKFAGETPRFGWDGVVQLKLLYLVEPPALTAGTVPLILPDDAKAYLARYMAAYFVQRAKVDQEAVVLEAIRKRDAALQALLEWTAAYPHIEAMA
ncbi:MAG TPA: hypothetical protein VKZ85_03300, partial [Woeseiaceae bacterium]|nr:hypothetical protein [Woeseiaceae bacterium]